MRKPRPQALLDLLNGLGLVRVHTAMVHGQVHAGKPPIVWRTNRERTSAPTRPPPSPMIPGRGLFGAGPRCSTPRSRPGAHRTHRT
jgi:hypothetical protein